MNWQAIETVPLDVDIQLWGSFRGGPGQWWPYAYFSSKSGAWVSSMKGDSGSFSSDWNFTHWMHPPVAPNA